MSSHMRAFVAAAGLLGLLVPTTAPADDNRHVHSSLSGLNEVHAPSLNTATVPISLSPGSGAVFSTGSGRIKLKIDKQDREIRYELTYAFPDAGNTPVAGSQFVNQAHLHFGQKHTTGGIAVWLCGSTENPGPAGTQTCPSPSGKVTGIIGPDNVLALAGQGFPAGEAGFAALLDALRAGTVYANVHTDRFGAGEIRGQLEDDRDDD